jgi:hypothetical protein
MNGSVRHLALPITWLAPELVRLPLPEERRSDCANCPMAGAPFLEDVRCCTYEPRLANFLVGRAIQRGDGGTDQVMARLAKPDGRTARGLAAPLAWRRAYRAKRDTDFGRNRDWRCPYWVPGALSCSIWRDRSAVCRTWHCKHDDGVHGHDLWVVVRGLIAALEEALAEVAMGRVAAPDDDADPAVWAGYYVATAECVAALEATDLLALEDPDLARLRALVREVHGRLAAPMPDVLAPVVRNVTPHDDQVELQGYSPWNTVTLPSTVFVLLAELDGQRPWQEALDRARAADPTVDPAWVERLWRHGVLRAADASDADWGFEGPDLDPDDLARLLDRDH